MLLPFLVLVFFINVEATPKGRVSRALPPEYRYVNIKGYQDCLTELFKPGQSSEEFCLPPSKPPGCPTSVWLEIKEEYDPNNFVGGSGGAPPGGGFVGVGAPAYLSIPGYKLCLKDYAPTGQSHTEFCKPATKPDDCAPNSWDRLKTDFNGDCPPTSYT